MAYPVGHKLSKMYGELEHYPEGKDIVSAQKALNASIAPAGIDKVVAGPGTSVQQATRIAAHAERNVLKTVKEAANQKAASTASSIAKDLQTQGIYLTDADRKKILASYDPTKRFAGKTLEQRVGVLGSTTKNDLTRILNNPDKKPATKALEAKHYLSGHSAGRNTFRPASTMIVSEANRAAQEIAANTGKYLENLGYKIRYIWELSTLPGRKRDICDDHAKRRVFTSQTLPKYPHPHCYCKVHLETDSGDLLSKMDIYAQAQLRQGVGGDMGMPDDVVRQIQMLQQARLKTRKDFFHDALSKPKTSVEYQRAKRLLKMQRDRIDKYMLDGSQNSLANMDRGLWNRLVRARLRGMQEVFSELGIEFNPELAKRLGLNSYTQVVVNQIPNNEVARLTQAIERYQKKELAQRVNAAKRAAVRFRNEAMDISSLVSENPAAQAGLRRESARRLLLARKELADAIGVDDAYNKVLQSLSRRGKDVVFNTDAAGIRRLTTQFGVKIEPVTNSRGKVLYGKLVPTEAAKLQKVGSPLKYAKQRAVQIAEEKLKFHKLQGVTDAFKRDPNTEGLISYIQDQKRVLIHSAAGTGKTPITISAFEDLVASGRLPKNAKILYVALDDTIPQVEREIIRFSKSAQAAHKAWLEEARKVFKRPPSNAGKAAMAEWNAKCEQYAIDKNPYTRAVRKGEAKAKRVQRLYNTATRSDEPGRWTVIGHKELVSDAKLIQRMGYDAIVIDEAHKVGDNIWKLLQKVGADAQYKVSLTGTAFRQEPKEMWNMLKWLRPDKYPNKAAFLKNFTALTQESSVFRREVQKNMKKDMMDWVVTRDVKMPKELQYAYKRLNINLAPETQARIRLLEGKLQDPGLSTAEKMRARNQLLAEIDQNSAGEKAKVARRLVQQAVSNNEKTIIFCNDLKAADAAAKALEKDLGKGAVINHGREATATRGEVVRAFKTQPGKQVLILTKSGSTGLNIPEANVLIHWDQPTNYAEWVQRVARGWRKGTKAGTKVFDLVTPTGYDRGRLAAIEKSRVSLETLSQMEKVEGKGLLQSVLKSSGKASDSQRALSDRMHKASKVDDKGIIAKKRAATTAKQKP